MITLGAWYVLARAWGRTGRCTRPEQLKAAVRAGSRGTGRNNDPTEAKGPDLVLRSVHGNGSTVTISRLRLKYVRANANAKGASCFFIELIPYLIP